MTQIHIAPTDRGIRVSLPGLTANLHLVAGGWEVGQFVQAGILSRLSVEQMIAEAFASLVIPNLAIRTTDPVP